MFFLNAFVKRKKQTNKQKKDSKIEQICEFCVLFFG